MENQNIKTSPEKEGVGKETDKFAKARKVVGKTAQLAGAAGLGVAGTMAANAINTTDYSDVNVDEVEAITPTEVDDVTGDESVGGNPVVGLNPNDIKIEDVDEIEINQSDDVIQIAEVEPEPITIGNQDAIISDNPNADSTDENGWIDDHYIDEPPMVSENIGDITDDIISNDLV
jgi:hypothetical protein